MYRRIVVSAFALALGAGVLEASSHTPLQWQQPVGPGRLKHTDWVRDKNRNFIDDEIERRFAPGDRVDVFVQLNRRLRSGEIAQSLSRFGTVRYVGKFITFVALERVRLEDVAALASHPSVAGVEWQTPGRIMDDVSSRAVQAGTSNTFSPETAADAGLDGAGVTIAILDTGVDDAHESFAGRFVAGYNGFTMAAGNPADDHGHGTHVAGIAMGRGTPGRLCRTPDDASPTSCAGVAPGSRLVDIKVCDARGSCPPLTFIAGLEWLGINATTHGVRTANASIGYCAEDDGSSVIAQSVNYVASLGVAMVVAHGNASNCGLPAGTPRTMAPGAASFAITVSGSADQGTVGRIDDMRYSSYLRGPRSDFDSTSPNLLALKPDISAPGQGVWGPRYGTLFEYRGSSGTSLSSPHVAGSAGLLIQALPSITPDSLKDLLIRTADTAPNTPFVPAVEPIWDRDFGGGLLNVWAAHDARSSAVVDVGFPTCVGAPAVPGQPCELTPPLPHYNNHIDIDTTAPPMSGVANTITARVRNYGRTASTVLVSFGVYRFGTGTREFHHVGTQRVDIPAATTIVVSQPWTPASESHQCVQISIGYGLDTNFENNVTQRNLELPRRTMSEPSTMWVENPFMVPAQFKVEAKVDRAGWKCEVNERSFALEPFEDPARELSVFLFAPGDAKPGEIANCDVAVYGAPHQGSPRLIGGAVIQRRVPEL